jgi:hypothetical protein
MGRVYASKAVRVDSFTAEDRWVGLSPPSPFDGRGFEEAVVVMKKREYRKDDLARTCHMLGVGLGEHLEDKEGWHGVRRQALTEEHDQRRAQGYDPAPLR